MLAYLDALLAAVAARDTSEIDRLLAHPLARILSPDALADASAERRAAETGATSVAPLRLFQLRHLTARLLGDRVAADSPESAESSGPGRGAPQAAAWADRRASSRHQMELPLSA
jgi:hypothetical protein